MTGGSWGGVADLLAAVCLIAGALLSLAAGVGLVRFPDVLARMHAATKPQVLGLLLILTGLGLRLGPGSDLVTLLAVGLPQLATAPIVAHIVGRAAYRSAHYRADLLIVDEMPSETDTAPEQTGPGPEPGETRRPARWPSTAVANQPHSGGTACPDKLST